MSVYNLPDLIGGLVEPGAPGELTPIASLERLALSLGIANAPLTRQSIRSVPDPWAQALITSEILLAGQQVDRAVDPLLAAIRAEWRALIATVALQQLFHDVYRLSLVALPPNGGPLRTLLLGKMAPASTASDKHDWANGTAILQLASVNNGQVGQPKPIALVVPDVILAPGRPFAHVRLPGAPWLAKGPVDPTSAALSADARAILADFASGLASAAGALEATGRASDVRTGLVMALNDLARDCSHHPSPPLARVAQSTNHDWPEPFRSALNATKTVQEGTGQSDCAVATRADLELPFASIILADPAIASTLGRPANTIRLFDRYMLSDAETRLAEIKGAAQKAGHLVLAPADLLSPRLTRVQEGTIPSHAQQAQQHLLPLTPAALLIAPGAELAASAIIEDRGHETTAGFGCMLSSDGGRRHRLVRAYKSSDVLVADRPTDLALWPDFRGDHWKRYAVRASFNTALEMALAAPAAGQLIAADLPDAPYERLAGWIASRVLADDDKVHSVGAGAYKLDHFLFRRDPDPKVAGAMTVGVQTWSTVAPEALFFKFGTDPIGCIVVAHTLIQALPERSATIAIDFGTSNTIVRVRIDADEPLNPGIAARVHHPIPLPPDKPDYGAGARGSLVDFLPVDGADMPFPTLMKARVPLVTPDDNLPGMAEVIFFADPARVDDPKTILEWIDAGLLKAEIKWDASDGGVARTRRFLSQLILMTAADLAAQGVAPERMKWRFSYPNAFDEDQRKTLEAAMKSAIGKLVPTVSADMLSVHTEAEAALQSLVVDGGAGASGKLVLMLDIGGGTTDVAICEGNRSIWQASFRLAARDFFTDVLARNVEILEQALKSSTGAVAQLKEMGGDVRARQLTELLLNRSDFSAKFRDAQIDGGPAWTKLDLTASAALGGMLWYLGRQTAASPHWKLTDRDFENITVALGGRGATYFNHEIMDPRMRKLGRMFGLGAGRNAPVRFFVSPAPKREVVDGLLAMAPAASPNDPDAIADSAQIAGLGLEVGTRAVPPDTHMANLDLAGHTPLVDLAEMRAFVADFREATGYEIDLNRLHGAGTIGSALQSAVKTRLNKGQFGQPAFIVALGELVKILSR